MTEQPFTPDIAGDISAAATATRAGLDAALAGAGISFGDWVTLVAIWNATMAHTGPPVSRDVLRRDLQARLGADGPPAAAVLAGLEAGGLVRDLGEATPGVQLTLAGERTFRSIRDTVMRFRADVLAGIPDAELETTRRVLRLIAERARVASAPTAA